MYVNMLADVHLLTRYRSADTTGIRLSRTVSLFSFVYIQSLVVNVCIAMYVVICVYTYVS